jgi:hypothetical protein
MVRVDWTLGFKDAWLLQRSQDLSIIRCACLTSYASTALQVPERERGSVIMCHCWSLQWGP